MGLLHGVGQLALDHRLGVSIERIHVYQSLLSRDAEAGNGVIERLHGAHRAPEALERRRGAGDRRDEIGVDIAPADAAEEGQRVRASRGTCGLGAAVLCVPSTDLALLCLRRDRTMTVRVAIGREVGVGTLSRRGRGGRGRGIPRR